MENNLKNIIQSWKDQGYELIPYGSYAFGGGSIDIDLIAIPKSLNLEWQNLRMIELAEELYSRSVKVKNLDRHIDIVKFGKYYDTQKYFLFVNLVPIFLKEKKISQLDLIKIYDLLFKEATTLSSLKKKSNKYTQISVEKILRLVKETEEELIVPLTIFRKLIFVIVQKYLFDKLIIIADKFDIFRFKEFSDYTEFKNLMFHRYASLDLKLLEEQLFDFIFKYKKVIPSDIYFNDILSIFDKGRIYLYELKDMDSSGWGDPNEYDYEIRYFKSYKEDIFDLDSLGEESTIRIIE